LSYFVFGFGFGNCHQYKCGVLKNFNITVLQCQTFSFDLPSATVTIVAAKFKSLFDVNCNTWCPIVKPVPLLLVIFKIYI